MIVHPVETTTIDGRAHVVEHIRHIADVEPQLAAHMRARGYDAYGYIRTATGEAIAYRSALRGAWHVVQRMRSRTKAR